MASSATSQALGISEFASGSFTGAGAAEVVTIGFKPRYVKVFNATGVIVWEKFEGMAANTAIKTVTAGTTTTDTTSAILIGDDTTANGLKGTFTVSSAAAVNAQVLSWVALG
jgi:hypothetical protein